jgi:hypothetical protein
MATKTILIDDLDGGEAETTIVFAIDGESYSLDLSHPNAEKFHKALAPFVSAATGLKQAHQNEVEAQAAAVDQRAAIRSWAKKKGYEVATRGKIPQEILDAYNKSTR